MMAIFLDRSDVKKECAATCLFLPRKTTKDKIFILVFFIVSFFSRYITLIFFIEIHKNG